MSTCIWLWCLGITFYSFVQHTGSSVYLITNKSHTTTSTTTQVKVSSSYKRVITADLILMICCCSIQVNIHIFTSDIPFLTSDSDSDAAAYEFNVYNQLCSLNRNSKASSLVIVPSKTLELIYLIPHHNEDETFCQFAFQA